MKKIFKTLALLVCTVCSLVLASCGGGNKPISYEKFHAKAVEVEAKAPKYTSGHIVVNIATKYESCTYDGDFTIDGNGSVTFSEEIWIVSWKERILNYINHRASKVLDENEDTVYLYNASTGFTVNLMLNDFIIDQYLFDTNGYFIKYIDPQNADNYYAEITWNK
jgi:hypothetical protein